MCPVTVSATVFLSTRNNGIVSELTVFVSLNDPVKFAVLKIKNTSGRKRRLSATSYYELVMERLERNISCISLPRRTRKAERCSPIITTIKIFRDRVVFLDSSEGTRFVSGDRNEFLGRTARCLRPP